MPHQATASIHSKPGKFGAVIHGTTGSAAAPAAAPRFVRNFGRHDSANDCRQRNYSVACLAIVWRTAQHKAKTNPQLRRVPSRQLGARPSVFSPDSHVPAAAGACQKMPPGPMVRYNDAGAPNGITPRGGDPTHRALTKGGPSARMNDTAITIHKSLRSRRRWPFEFWCQWKEARCRMCCSWQEPVCLRGVGPRRRTLRRPCSKRMTLTRLAQPHWDLRQLTT